MEIKITCAGADLLPIDTLLEFQGELKKITKANLTKLKNSILENGFTAPIFVWPYQGDHFILDGHQRLKALLELRQEGTGIPLLPVAYIYADTHEDAKTKLLHITSQYGEFSLDGLKEFTQGMDFDFDTIRLAAGAFDTSSIQIDDETIGDDEVPDIEEESVSIVGEIYQLGGHRLMCGDSTDAEQVNKLMDGKKADLWVTDPPYNVNYESKTTGDKINNDDMDDASFRAFLQKAFKEAVDIMKPGACFYIWHADSEGYNFRSACKDVGLKVRQCLIWNKNSMVMGRQDYHWKHEPCLYGWKDGSAHFYSGGRCLTTVYDETSKPNPKKMTKEELVSLCNDLLKEREKTTVIDMERPSRSLEHPTMKPVKLIQYLVENSSNIGGIVADFFGGSGTTLITAAKTGRICNMMELDPKYCDVIRRRWTKWATENGKDIGSGGLE